MGTILQQLLWYFNIKLVLTPIVSLAENIYFGFLNQEDF